MKPELSRVGGDCGSNTTREIVEILVFTHFCRFWTFNQLSENQRKKMMVDRITVVVAVEVDK